MKQVLQNLSSGETTLIEAPSPQLRTGTLLIDTKASLISTGTERMLIDFGKSNLVQKARSQPEKLHEVFDKIGTDGLLTTMSAVQSKLGQPIPLGYCNVGVVCETDTNKFNVGDRVVSNGPHADVVCVHANLCAKIPQNVSDEEATFAVPASIGLQGLRLAQPALGECFAVIGVGLIGLLVVQLLRANGCRVLAIDLDKEKLELARSFGAEICNLANNENPVSVGMKYSRGKGLDGVIITASTKSSDPVSQAANMCRKRGRIVLVGVTGLQLNRSEFYEKELTFQISCSYGPGRYDASYEQDGNDYPIGFVRWTVQRNFQAVLDMLATRILNVKPLISHRIMFEKAPKAYEILFNDKSALSILLQYDHSITKRHDKSIKLANPQKKVLVKPFVGFVGAGNYASRFLIPAFKKSGFTLHTIASAGGLNAVMNGNRMGFLEATSDTDSVCSNPDVDLIAIATRHNNHAKLTVQALRAGKHVFVEKPLALTLDELQEIEDAYAKCGRELMVGFNRRFAPQVQTMKQLLNSMKQPKTFVMVMNAGFIPSDHWTQDPKIGGGRIIGEACHYVDLMRFLAGSPIKFVEARCLGNSHEENFTEDNVTILLGFEDGSCGTIHYLANGGRSFPKERIEIFTEGRTLQLDNFRKLKGFNWPGFRKQNLWLQDKGQYNCVTAFANSIIEGVSAPIKAEELFEVAKVTIEISNRIRALN